MKTIEIWSEPEEGGYTCSTTEQCAKMRESGAIEPGSKLLHSFEASTWFEAMTKYYELMEFGEYKPQDPPDPIIYELFENREDMK